MKSTLRPGLAPGTRKHRWQDFHKAKAPSAPARRPNRHAIQRSSAQVAGPIIAILTVLLWLVALGPGYQTAVTLVTLLGFLAIILGLFSPGVGIIGIGLLSTMDAITRNLLLTGGLLRWNTFNYWLLFVIAINLFFLIRLSDLHSRILQLFILILSVELFISPNLLGGLLDIFNIAAMFGLVVYLARGYQVPGGLYWMAVISGLAAAVGGLFFYLQISALPYVNPNSWALFPLSAIFAICLGYPTAGQHRLGRLVLLLLAALNFLWIFLSGSRGNMLVALFSLLFLFIWTRQITWKLAFILAGWVAIGILSFQFAAQQEYAFMRLQKLINPEMTLEQRTSGRSDIAAAGWRLFLQNPLGVGTGAFALRISEIGYLNEEVAAHSGWIKVLAENGIPGMLLLTAYTASFAVIGWRKRDQDLLMLGLLTSASFGVALLSKEFEGKSLWLLAAGATVLLNSEQVQTALHPGTRIHAMRGGPRLAKFRPGISPRLSSAQRRPPLTQNNQATSAAPHLTGVQIPNTGSPRHAPGDEPANRLPPSSGSSSARLRRLAGARIWRRRES